MSEKKSERRGLGRGLSALMADVNADARDDTSSNAGSDINSVAIETLHPNKDQPRRSFDQNELDDLSASIKEKGIIQPLIVRAHRELAGEYEIVAGERRWRAAQAANIHMVPVIVRDYSDSELLEIAIIENIQRAELNAIEEAAGYRQLMDRFGHTQDKIAEALGRSRSHIANLLRLLNLPDPVQKFVVEGKLTAGHARALITVDRPEELAEEIIRKGLSVRAAESLAKRGSKGSEQAQNVAAKDADTVALENDLSAVLGLKIRIDHKSDGESGRLSIEYATLDDLDRVCGLLSALR